jgi:Domain of unknown function (DUF1918)
LGHHESTDRAQLNVGEEADAMHAVIGDRLHVHGKIVGQADRTGEIVEVHGAGGEPPYLVRFEDGHVSLVFPGPDSIIEHPRGDGTKGKKRSAHRS